MASELARLVKPRRKNPTHRPRNDGYCWNVSHIARALGFHRDTVRRKLNAAGIQPDGHVNNSPVYDLARAVPVLFDAPPRASG
jgi:hypothetical protein